LKKFPLLQEFCTLWKSPTNHRAALVTAEVRGSNPLGSTRKTW
jgi:hypothetical protein